MKSTSYILGLAVVGLCLPQEATAQQRGRTFAEQGRQADRRPRQDDQWFDPGWWHEWPDRDGDRRPRDGKDDSWFDPGWWHEWPERGRDRWQHPGARPRAALGVVFRDTRDGVRIASVVPRSPARRAGLQRGDVLLVMDGRRIDSSDEARRLLRRRQPGDRVRVVFERRGRVRQTVATLQSRRAVY